ncbi:MAG TPA: alcohol dehydrogenase catalytic domain-containing protein [Aggregatilineaceae bacterium]|nr:alcohol dehydrogenase catalytic domain-containing protein [Aggregatilineaceae bacterium]
MGEAKDKVKAVVFEDNQLRVVTIPAPQPAPDEVLIRPRMMGICNTDIELTRGYKSFRGVLGHEFVGEVIEGPAEWVGKRVVGEINISCGSCDMCERGIPSQCRKRLILGMSDYDGAFCEQFRLPVRNLWQVPNSVADDEAVFAEPLAAACQVLESVDILPSDHVVVLGAGKLGLLVAQALWIAGADVSVVVRREQPAALLSSLNIRTIPGEEKPDHMADCVVDCTGSAEGFAAALEWVRPRGTIVLKSTYHGLPQADLTSIAVNEIHVVGSRCGPFKTALELLKMGLLTLRPMITAQYTLDEAAAAFEAAEVPGALKVVMTL